MKKIVMALLMGLMLATAPSVAQAEVQATRPVMCVVKAEYQNIKNNSPMTKKQAHAIIPIRGERASVHVDSGVRTQVREYTRCGSDKPYTITYTKQKKTRWLTSF